MESLKITCGRYTDWVLDVDSAWYESGYGDDGFPAFKCSHQIRIQSPEGYVYFAREYHDQFSDAWSELLMFYAEAQLNRLNVTGWIEGRPVYGSIAYQREGCEQEQIERERECE